MQLHEASTWLVRRKVSATLLGHWLMVVLWTLCPWLLVGTILAHVVVPYAQVVTVTCIMQPAHFLTWLDRLPCTHVSGA